MIYSLVYVSSATSLFTTPELTSLLAAARSKNSAAGLTGMLLYKDGNFMQVLEGEEATVKRVFQTIRDDPRHKGVLILLESRTAERSFADWSMAFRDLRSPELADLPGFHDFMNTSLSAQEFESNPDRARKLLLSFKSRM